MAGKQDNKNVRVTVRFTTKEWEEIEVQMKNFDLRSTTHDSGITKFPHSDFSAHRQQKP